jgi:hypothetical protein
MLWWKCHFVNTEVSTHASVSKLTRALLREAGLANEWNSKRKRIAGQ